MTDDTTRPLPADGDEPTRALPEDEPTKAVPDEEPIWTGATATSREASEPAQDGPVSQGGWQPPYEEDTGGRHPLSVAHLVAGLVFLGIATSWLLRETGVVDSEATGWFLPLTLVVAGAIGLLAWFSSARGKTR